MALGGLRQMLHSEALEGAFGELGGAQARGWPWFATVTALFDGINDSQSGSIARTRWPNVSSVGSGVGKRNRLPWCVAKASKHGTKVHPSGGLERGMCGFSSSCTRDRALGTERPRREGNTGSPLVANKLLYTWEGPREPTVAPGRWCHACQ